MAPEGAIRAARFNPASNVYVDLILPLMCGHEPALPPYCPDCGGRHEPGDTDRCEINRFRDPDAVPVGWEDDAYQLEED